MVNPYQDITAQSLAKAAEMVQGLNAEGLKKALDTSKGVRGPSLHAPLVQLAPLLTAFLLSIPAETVTPGSDAYAYKAITRLTMPKGTPGEREAADLFSTTVVDRSNAYKNVGVGGEVTWEAELEAGGFEPALKLETANTLLVGLRVLELKAMGGNVTALAAPANPVVSVAATGGSIGTSTPRSPVEGFTVPTNATSATKTNCSTFGNASPVAAIRQAPSSSKARRS